MLINYGLTPLSMSLGFLLLWATEALACSSLEGGSLYRPGGKEGERLHHLIGPLPPDLTDTSLPGGDGPE